ncbi:putative PPM-type phosphatase domain, protein phosphatase 2C family [Septoria linicola]|nr:putative PPM-type phosphatase domain, protein phosphatase 2C family [Septoria linicola]
MLSHTLRVGQRQTLRAHRTTRFSRRYNNNALQGPHTTYFQQPVQPPRKWPRRLGLAVWSVGCFAAGTYAWARLAMGPLDDLADMMGGASEVMEDVVAIAALDAIARETPPITLEEADELLRARSGYSVTSKAVAHTCQSPANMPCEDTWSAGAFTLFNDTKKDWCEWAIFDGHAGPRTAQVLKQLIPSIVGERLWDAKCMDKPYVPNDPTTINTLKRAFLELDQEIIGEAGKLIQSGGPLAQVVAVGAAAFSGSCALLALYDPARSVLRVANVGDSRAVFGRWDGTKYVVQPLSIDQTGFNQDEVARLNRDHPGEDKIVDPNSGRVHGIAISRAFGDARWKWPNSLTKLAHDKFWGPSPRPDSMIKTPPYLTAEPEIMETKVRTDGEHPDFLIMASDGLWDQMSSEDAVTCVQMWLEKNKPAAFLEEQPEEEVSSWKDLLKKQPPPGRAPTFTSAADLANDEDVYFDEVEGCTKWKVSPKHFVNEDENCGIHLVKNALGGKRRDLFTGVMSVQTPLARYVRDDITVHVIFFGQDTEPILKKNAQPASGLRASASASASFGSR